MARLARDRRNRWLAMPPLVYLVALFHLPVLILLGRSLFAPTFTLDFYREALGEYVYIRTFLNTFIVAGEVTLLALLLGYPLAYWLTILPSGWRRMAVGLILLPFWTSVLVRTFAWMVLLGRNGIVNRWLLELGVIDKPIAFIFNQSGVVIGVLHILLPFMIFPLYASMVKVDKRLIQAAQACGAETWQVLWYVRLPLTLPGVVAGSFLVFGQAVGFFITPALLGGGRYPMIATQIEQQVNMMLNWGLGSALSVILLIITLGAYAIYVRTLRLERLAG
jgi:ABC-type spermidine/putrescine transport system permease subunit I